MGLYLCVFADDVSDEELEGVEVGGYDDFNAFRQTIADQLEPAGWGSRFPILMLHPDSDGRWTPQEAAGLADELLPIGDELSRLAAAPLDSGSWQHEIATQIGLRPSNLLEGFFDVDGEPLVDRLMELITVARAAQRDIRFQ